MCNCKSKKRQAPQPIQKQEDKVKEEKKNEKENQ